MKPTPIQHELDYLRKREKELLELKRLRESVSALEMDHGHAESEPKSIMATILKVVSNHFKLSPSLILGPRRNEFITLPRFYCFYLSRELSNASLSQVGMTFGNRDHGTVIHGIKALRNRMDTQPKARKDYDDIRAEVLAALGRGDVVVRLQEFSATGCSGASQG